MKFFTTIRAHLGSIDPAISLHHHNAKLSICTIPKIIFNVFEANRRQVRRGGVHRSKKTSQIKNMYTGEGLYTNLERLHNVTHHLNTWKFNLNKSKVYKAFTLHSGKKFFTN